jgi:endogenous inhibitor of DNA gyrase (YacG/DUF329 family)
MPATIDATVGGATAGMTILKVRQRRIATKPCPVCGGTIEGQPNKVRARTVCSRKCHGIHNGGENHYNWRGGGTHRQRMFNSTEYKAWRRAVLERDGGRCRWCDDEGVRCYQRLEVHHIIPVASAPERALDADNAITLCRSHHNQTRGREHEFAEFFAGLLGAALVAPPAPNRKDRVPLEATADQLRGMYWAQQMSTLAIGAALGVTPECIQKHMRRHGIPTRTNREAAAVRQRPKQQKKRAVVTKMCAHCGVPVGGRTPAEVRRRKYCSYACYGAHTSGANHYTKRTERAA